MFTGIVQELGTVVDVRRTNQLHRLTIQAPKTVDRLGLGESVAVNGVCLSVVRVRDGSMSVEVIPETSRLTNLGKLSVGNRVNLERSLALSDRLNGHLVLGHVDGMGRIARLAKAAGEVVLEIRVEPALRRYVVPKGSVAVDGVSLTVGARLARNGFSVFLIPTTIQRTTLGLRRAGDLVNIEVDYLAKLTAHLLARFRQFPRN
jgi:riboflavin synthase